MPPNLMLRPLKVLYVSPEFPKVRHGFEGAEIEELSRWAEVHLVSLRSPTRDGYRWLAESFDLSTVASTTVLDPRGAAWGLPSQLMCSTRKTGGELARLARFCGVAPVGGLKAVAGGVIGLSLSRIVQEVAADVIHADFVSLPATAAMVASGVTGVPYTMCGHAFDVFSNIPAGRATRSLLAMKLRRAACTFAENSACVARLTSIDSQARIVLKRNGVRSAPPLISGPSITRIVGMGALVPKKGFDLLVRAAALLRSEGREVPVIELYGSGPEAVGLVRLARDLGVPLEMRGAYSQGQLDAILEDAIAVVPSRRLPSGDSDGVPTVLIEALMRRRPIIGANVGSVADLIENGVTGILVPPEDERALAGAIRQLLDNAPLAEHLATRGRQRVVDGFTVDQTAGVLLKELLKVRSQ